MWCRSRLRGRDVAKKQLRDVVEAGDLVTVAETGQRARHPEHERFLPIAQYAKIPAARTGGFLLEFYWAVQLSGWHSRIDDERRKFKAAINEVMTAINTLVCALDYLDKRDGSAMLDCFLNIQIPRDSRRTHWSKRQRDLFFWGLYPAVMPEGGPLAEYKRQLAFLEKAAQQVSVQRLPKRGEHRPKRLIKSVLELVKRHGGNLSYDKNSNSGDLANVVSFLRAELPSKSWKGLSPSTVQRLKSGPLLVRDAGVPNFDHAVTGPRTKS